MESMVVEKGTVNQIVESRFPNAPNVQCKRNGLNDQINVNTRKG